MGHPLVVVTVSVGIVVLSRLARRDALSVLLVLFVSMILPTTLLLFGVVRSGDWYRRALVPACFEFRAARRAGYICAFPCGSDREFSN